ncbi:MAG TPA: nucleoside monophosphate kinase [Candidatus Saccharimonadales bacterium]|jgi:adenylate kinase family enzyme|nr:nucleoside monophosphate kinase [Candidatus Saccharimonadales bacterium]
MSELNFIVLTGRFAAGKDTQAGRLLNRIGIESSEIISTGDIYTSAKSGTGEYAHFHQFIVPYIEDIDIHGKLLPDSVMTQIVQEIISEKVRMGKETFIFTGFPRTVPQLEYFDQMISDFRQEAEANSVFIEYKITDEVSRERTHQRRVEIEKRGEIARPWDTDEGLTKRIATYYEQIEPMIKRLQEEGRLTSIDATRGMDEIEIETSARLSKERG